MENKITHIQLAEFIVAYYRGEYPYMRLGQAFFMAFKEQMRNVVDPDLFYAVGHLKPYNIIVEKYVID